MAALMHPLTRPFDTDFVRASKAFRNQIVSSTITSLQEESIESVGPFSGLMSVRDVRIFFEEKLNPSISLARRCAIPTVTLRHMPKINVWAFGLVLSHLQLVARSYDRDGKLEVSLRLCVLRIFIVDQGNPPAMYLVILT